MKTLKIRTIISAILSLAMIVSLFPGFTALAEDETKAANEEAITAYGFLKAVGAMDENEVPYDSELPITRAHFVKMALHASNDAPKVLLSNDEVFYDVDMNTKYENYIETAYRIGYISGAADGLFNPEDHITLAQATKILCNILGYEKNAEAIGGYPGGYLIIAQRIDLLDGIGVKDNEVLTMEDAVLLIYNAVNVDLMQIVSIGEQTETKAFDGRNLLTERHKIEKAEGIIEANGYTDLYAQESDLEKGEISIDGVTYKAGNSGAEDYIGYNVTAYYDASEENTDKEVIYVEITDENTVITANGRDLAVNGEDIEYYTETSSKKIKFGDFLTFIVNGKMSTMDLEDLESVTKGEINFISNDGNASVDVIKVTRYDTLLVQGISVSGNLIITDDGTKFELDPESDDYTFEIIKNNNVASLSDVASGNIILVCEGKGNGLVHKKIIVSDKVLTASFDEIGDETAVISGKTYNVDGINVTELKSGTVYEIKFDAFDNISYIKKDNDIVYGYLYGLAKVGMENPKCRIFTENSRWGDLFFAKKVEFNGVTVSGEEVYETLKSDPDFRQLIRYNVNNDAEIIRLQTATEVKIGSGDANGDGINEELQAIEEDTFRFANINQTYRPTPRSFDGICFVDTSAKIFEIPDDMDMDDFKISTRTMFSERNYSIVAYDTNEYLNCEVFTLNGSSSKNSTVLSTDKCLVIKSKGMVLDSDGNAVPSVKGWWSGIEMSFGVKIGDGYLSQDTYDKLSMGDIIYFKYDENGNIISIPEYYSANTQAPSYQKGGYYSTARAFGKIVKSDFKNSRVILGYGNGVQSGYIYNSKTAVYLFDTKEETFRKASTAEFLADDIIVANMSYHNLTEVVIIR